MMFHECEARYPRLDPAFELADAVMEARPHKTFLAGLLHRLGFTDV